MFELDRFIEECRGALTQPSPELAVKELLAEVISRPSDLIRSGLGIPARSRFSFPSRAPAWLCSYTRPPGWAVLAIGDPPMIASRPSNQA